MSQELEPASPAATPGEVLHLPAKRVKKDPLCPETSPVVPAMATEEDWSNWSTLPPDLVRLVADSLLATNDLDCYMCFRAVCPGWRAATHDPRSDACGPRFRLRRWIVFDKVFQSPGKLLLLNTDTGRFLHRKLPLCSGDHYVVATTLGGYFLLAGKSAPHARVLNPLTGVVIPFPAPVPPVVGSADFWIDSSLTEFCDSSAADPHSERLILQLANDFFRKAAVGGVMGHLRSSVVPEMLTCLRKFMPADPGYPIAKVFSGDLPGDAYGSRCFLVDLDGHICIVLKLLNPQEAPSLFALQFDTETGKLLHLKTTGKFAILIGDHRCFTVNADKLPGIEADCVYFTELLGSSAWICKCNIKDTKVERISEAADFVKQDKKFVLVADRPHTIIHLLASYTINIPDSHLAFQQIS
ncbi:uncharacterized protein LOC119272970 [Triticum dicoccoides]|uniref:uncharacterized protein LOC119272970 n=1 Tax=Triticum dicoccoides TaxID=85692 RepID=UPI001890398D|nr:uncharacterized protein LOC119272970 [Triticum dicoccoides]